MPLYLDDRRQIIPTVYADPYLELVRLLIEGAGLEHTLLLAYLSAMFSIKDEYRAVRGDLRDASFLEHDPYGRRGTSTAEAKETFLTVCIEEMQHLDMVNRFLSDLGATPALTPHAFPCSADIYPFTIALRPLDRLSSAIFLWIEADSCALSLQKECTAVNEPAAFIREVRKVLRAGGSDIDETQPDHIGSLYHRIAILASEVAAHPPPFLPADLPWGDHVANMAWITQEGEVSHYRFFRSVFTGEAFGADRKIWGTKNPAYPSLPLVSGTAFPQHRNTLRDPSARRVAWLANLHYWLLLTLLDARYRLVDLRLQYHATDAMTMGLWVLGLDLARTYGVAMPFDPMGSQYALGRNGWLAHRMITRLLTEAIVVADGLAADRLLPKGYDRKLLTTMLAAVGED